MASPAQGIAPLFTTAPRIKLKIGGVNIAYAIGLNINVSVNIQPVSIIGKFGPVSLEPTLYNTVTGTMQIIRLVSKESLQNQLTAAAAVNAANSFNNQATASIDNNGNEVIAESQILPSSATEGFTGDSNSPLSQQSLHRHMSPKTVLLSRTFDFDLYMKVPNSANNAVQDLMGTQNPTGDDLTNIPSTDLYTEVPWMRIEKVRISSRNTNIALGQLVNEPVSFQGLLATPVNLDEQSMFELDNGQTQQP